MTRRLLRAGLLTFTAAATVAAWLVLLAPNLPLVDIAPSADLARLACVIAVTGSLTFLLRYFMRPADELYNAGKLVGRVEAKHEEESPPPTEDRVTHLHERRIMRVISGGGVSPE